MLRGIGMPPMETVKWILFQAAMLMILTFGKDKQAKTKIIAVNLTMEENRAGPIPEINSYFTAANKEMESMEKWVKEKLKKYLKTHRNKTHTIKKER